ncbi:NAD(P)-dependent oxidoreductase [Pseudonocardia sp. ICBG601]|uniref:NAD(P)-dependent oxidoreductase n=1 Tax=Pseudonocardia sp. ICBG601 TaxID=2846759 RepID=UPI001CF6DC4A|nr:NAD(P)-dependent oxidoreductase [Pseudonocardia sp. ICBG601]
MHIVFVGVGAIGLPMAARLVGAGFTVTGVDPAPTAAERAAGTGLTVVPDLAAAGSADVVVVMVATPEQLDDLVGAATADGLTGRCWIVMSTVGPDAVRAQAARLAAAGAAVLDVPVTGGVARARTGELTLFAAGPAADVDAAAPVLGAMGTVRRVGTDPGDGQAVKIVNQHLCSVHLAAAAEALALAGRLGLDRAEVLSLVEGGAGGSWMLTDRGPRMLSATDVEVTSTVGIFVKDSGLVADAAATAGADTPLLAAAHDRFLRASRAGLLHRDDSRVIETY